MFLFSHKKEAIIDVEFPFIFYQQVVVIHVLQDTFSFLLEKLEKKSFLAFLQSFSGFKCMSFEIGFKMEFKFPFYNYLFLLKESVRRIQVSSHLID
jgi:hypothetical protein